MATAFSDVICNYFMQQVDDIRLTQEMAEMPALGLRKQAVRMLNAIPDFSRPPEMQEWLANTPAVYDDYLHTAVSAQTAPIEIPTGKVGYELCSAALMSVDAAGNVAYSAIPSAYDNTTGVVTLNTDLTQGQKVDIDFYTDGTFANELTVEQKKILGLCMAANWFGRFSNTWLNITPKNKDKSSDNGSESAQMTANTVRLKETRLALADKLLRYEESEFYRQRIRTGARLKTPP